MTWVLSILAVAPFILALFAYWGGLHVAQMHLPRARREAGDSRVVPDLYSPETSHRWFGVILTERTGSYGRRLRMAIATSRWALVLLPFAFVASMALLGQVGHATYQVEQTVVPAVTVPENP